MEQSMTPIAAQYNKTVSSSAIGLTNAAIGFTAAQVAVADVMLIRISANAIRRRVDGTDPTTTVGLYLDTNQPFTIWRGNEIINAWKMIRDGSSDATVSVELYRW